MILRQRGSTSKTLVRMCCSSNLTRPLLTRVNSAMAACSPMSYGPLDTGLRDVADLVGEPFGEFPRQDRDGVRRVERGAYPNEQRRGVVPLPPRAPVSGRGSLRAARSSPGTPVGGRGSLRAARSSTDPPAGGRGSLRAARSSTDARRAGKGLGDLQPALRVVPLGRQVKIPQRPPLGDQKTKVLGAAGDPLRGVRRPPRPGAAVGGAQLDEKRLGGGGQPVDGGGVGAGGA